jgi:hypothetical protein
MRFAMVIPLTIITVGVIAWSTGGRELWWFVVVSTLAYTLYGGVALIQKTLFLYRLRSGGESEHDRAKWQRIKTTLTSRKIGSKAAASLTGEVEQWVWAVMILMAIKGCVALFQ